MIGALAEGCSLMHSITLDALYRTADVQRRFLLAEDGREVTLKFATNYLPYLDQRFACHI